MNEPEPLYLRRYKTNRPKKSSLFPAGWFDYHPIKDIINDACIAPFKCPLPAAVFQSEEYYDYKWTPFDVIQRVPNLGLVIDLTFKEPAYYNPIEFLDQGIDYIKIMCMGHVVPAESIFKKFCDTVDSFLERNKNDVVGVHCTHGVNRTGYMICRYLVERCSYNPSSALQTFADKRGYPVERENYIEAVKKSKSI